MTKPGDHDDPAEPRHRGNGNAEQDLRATTDALRIDAEQLVAVEKAKAALDPRDPETDRLSGEAVELGDRIRRETHAEQELAEKLR